VSIGIGYGDILDLDGRELFGGEVNLASKLAEDIGEPGEILLTRAAMEAIEGLEGWWYDERRARISGLNLEYFAIERTG
jgi:adenylate cyclase